MKAYVVALRKQSFEQPSSNFDCYRAIRDAARSLLHARKEKYRTSSNSKAKGVCALSLKE